MYQLLYSSTLQVNRGIMNTRYHYNDDVILYFVNIQKMCVNHSSIIE